MAIVIRYFGDRSTVTSGSISIVFEADDDTMTRATGSFITDGFQVGDVVTVSGTTNNNGDKVITAVDALVLTSSTALTDETDATTTIALKSGDGTSWAKRGALLTGTSFSAVFKALDFTSDSIEVRLEGGQTYTHAEGIQLTFWAAPPTLATPLIIHGCDSSGNRLAPPDPNWVSAQPEYSVSTFPVLRATTAIYTSDIAAMLIMRCVSITSSGRAGGVFTAACVLEWCRVENSTNNAAATGLSNGNASLRSCIVVMSGTSFSYAINRSSGAGPGGVTDNVRVVDAGNGTSGTMGGVVVAGNQYPQLDHCTFIGFVNIVYFSGTSTAANVQATHCVFVGSSGDTILLRSDAAQAGTSSVTASIIVDSGAYAINAQSAANVIVRGCRLRDNTSGNFAGMGNYPEDLGNDVSAGTDSDEFVDAAAGDYRIKATSALWGKGIGAGDGPATIVG